MVVDCDEWRFIGTIGNPYSSLGSELVAALAKGGVETPSTEAGVSGGDSVIFGQVLRLPSILGAEASPAQHQDHRIGSLKIGKFPALAGVIG
jgi:hypothetical protein